MSQYALYHIQKRLEKHPKFEDNIEEAFKETFVEVDRGLVDEPVIEVSRRVFPIRSAHYVVPPVSDEPNTRSLCTRARQLVWC